MNKAFFIDKDGTLVDNSGYPNIIPKDNLLEKHVLVGLRHIQNNGYKIIVISNQPWIAKQLMTAKEVESVFRNLVEKLKKFGISIAGYYYCPHQSSDNCECKKPKAKLIFDAAKKHNIDLTKSYIVGDMNYDILAGKNANIKTILVLTGNGKKYKEKTEADFVINNLNEIYNVIWARKN